MRQQEAISEIPNGFFELIRCPVCGGDRQQLFLKVKYGDLKQKASLNYSSIGVSLDTYLYVKKCRECGFVFVNPRVKAEYENLVYNECKKNMIKNKPVLKNPDNEFFIRSRARKISYLNVILRVLSYTDLSKPLTLFDYGSGFGISMSLAQTFGINTYGVDIDRNMIEFCKAQGLNVCAPENFDNEYPGVKADIILWQSNIEHLINLPAVAAYIRDKCNRGAILYVDGLTPALILHEKRRKRQYVKAHFIEHVNFFPTKTLDRFLGKYGFVPLPKSMWIFTRSYRDAFRYFSRILGDGPLVRWMRDSTGGFQRLYEFRG